MTPNDPRHGTLNGYSNLHCRCDACRGAWADYCYDLRQNRLGRLWKADVEHGNANTYSNWGCRCRPCTEAMNKQRRDWATRRRRPVS
jgi:hypothetical protein